jgi:hypothetical protein
MVLMEEDSLTLFSFFPFFLPLFPLDENIGAAELKRVGCQASSCKIEPAVTGD